MRKQRREINLYDENENVPWRESVLFKDGIVGRNRKEMNFLDLGEQQHLMALASWTIYQLERDWHERRALDEAEGLKVDMEVSIGGFIRE
jgi:hypothetical protein